MALINRLRKLRLGFTPSPSIFTPLTKSLGDLNKQVEKTTGNDFVHLNLATEDSTMALTKMTDNFVKSFVHLNLATEDSTRALTKMIQDFVESFKSVWGSIDQYLINPLKTVGDLWSDFLDTLRAGAGGTGAGRHGKYPTISNDPKAVINTLTYGPKSEGATAADMRQIWGATIAGQKIRLASGRSAAISPGLLGAYPLGSLVDEIQGGRVVRHRRIEDTSWIRKGVPTHNTIENYNDINIGRVHLRRSPLQRPASEEEAQKAVNVTINYNVTHNHGAGLDEQRMAVLHRRHIDQMKKDLAQCIYERNRSAFDGAEPI